MSRETTDATDVCWSAPVDGIAYLIPAPKVRIYKEMPCGHSGILIGDKWVCQTCISWELLSQSSGE